MHVSDLIALDARLARLPGSPGEPLVTAATADSRRAGPGVLVAGIPGTRDDGRRYLAEAVAAGAPAVLVGADTDPAAWGLDPSAVAVLTSSAPRASLARLAAALAGPQPPRIAAVTGTNGKSSTVAFARQLRAALGGRAASLGTLGPVLPADIPAEAVRSPGPLTTPAPEQLYPALADLQTAGVDWVFLEASSHGLEQGRLDGLAAEAGAFLNLSHDHLDYHRDAAAYFDAKAHLPRSLLPAGSALVANADDATFPRLSEIARHRGLALWDFGYRARTIRLVEVTPGRRDLAVTLAVQGTQHRLRLPVTGTFQAHNAAAALALTLAQGGAVDPALAALERLVPPAGRLAEVTTTPVGAPVFVDYAHSPGALEPMLAALRPHVPGRLWLVVGCGGDRDRAKRPVMGEIAARLADRVVVTDDNPRSEDPAAIRREVLAACPGATERGDRAAAIRHALAQAAGADTVVIAGKGHETDQVVGDVVRSFDDAAEAHAAVAALAGEAPP